MIPTASSVFTVSQLNLRARQLLEISFSNVRVQGEISNLSRPASGHWYFTLKDEHAQIRCAMFRSRTQLLRFSPKEGDLVEVRGKISLYENRGDFQLIADGMQPAGEGALLLAFQQLKERLAQEGLFDSSRKRPLPKVRKVGIITSPTGAAIHDMLTVLKRRDPSIEVLLYPSAVQGKDATATLVAAIERANRDQLVDVLIVGRGGGSLEDLWCFNEEALARAMYHSTLPIISAVGHETDVTIADFVADMRAPTPSAAAELISQDAGTQLQHLERLRARLNAALNKMPSQYQQRLNHWQQRLKKPTRLLQQYAQQLDFNELRLQRALSQRLQQQNGALQHLKQSLSAQHPARQLHLQHERLAQLKGQLIRLQRQQLQQRITLAQPWYQRLLNAQQQQQKRHLQQLATQAQLLQSLSPLNVLARGYAITQNTQGQVVTHCQHLHVGERVRTRLHTGWFESEVVKVSEENSSS